MTKREIARAVRLYRAGRTLREVAAEMELADRSGGSLYRHLRGQLPPRRRGPRGRTDVTDAQILELRDELQLAWSEVAEEVGMSKTGVQVRYRAAHGLVRDRVTGAWVRRAPPA